MGGEERKGEECRCNRERVAEEYRNLLSILRFYRMSGKLYVLDMVANASSSGVFSRVMADIVGELERAEPVSIEKLGTCCYVDECSGVECEWYRRLGARVDRVDEKIIVCVPCPRYDRRMLERELSCFTQCMESGKLAPYDLVLYAYT